MGTQFPTDEKYHIPTSTATDENSNIPMNVSVSLSYTQSALALPSRKGRIGADSVL